MEPFKGKTIIGVVSENCVDLNLTNATETCLTVPSQCNSDELEHMKVQSQLQPEEPTLVDGALVSRSKPTSTSSGRITVDAVHPFFTGYRNIKHDKSTSTDNQQFYCNQCDQSFELSQEAVNEHFSVKQHRPVEKCVYCHSSVYEYFYNENRYYYHRCNEQQTPIDGSNETLSRSNLSLVDSPSNSSKDCSRINENTE